MLSQCSSSQACVNLLRIGAGQAAELLPCSAESQRFPCRHVTRKPVLHLPTTVSRSETFKQGPASPEECYQLDSQRPQLQQR